MPGKPVRVKRSRARKNAFREEIHRLADEMEEPLAQAADLIRALDLMGYGLCSIEDKDAGQPILGVARALSTNLSAVRNHWLSMMKVIASQPRE